VARPPQTELGESHWDIHSSVPCFETSADDYLVKDEIMEAAFEHILSRLNGTEYSNTYLERKRREVLFSLRAREAAQEKVEWL
jgi:hypothetical protein